MIKFLIILKHIFNAYYIQKKTIFFIDISYYSAIIKNQVKTISQKKLVLIENKLKNKHNR